MLANLISMINQQSLLTPTGKQISTKSTILTLKPTENSPWQQMILLECQKNSGKQLI
jgi:hypothetical protein